MSVTELSIELAEVRERSQMLLSDSALRAVVGDYLDHVIMTLDWIEGRTNQAPITGRHIANPTMQDLMSEHLHAQDIIEQNIHSDKSTEACRALIQTVDWRRFPAAVLRPTDLDRLL